MTEPFRTRLEDLVEYQDGSVVSRELITKNAGTVTVFSFDKGQGLSEHTTPYDALVQIMDGKASITISGVEYILEKGEMIIMPANEPHGLRALTPFKMLLTMVRE
ncbi:MAG: cupin domain-containing protein [Candidatus Thermoplasmatota archaeon]|nr:cupin domain-containing protein [Candidatus Thermoplasmatota archaeon]